MTLESFKQRIKNLNLSVSATNPNKGGEEHWIIIGGKSVVHWWPFSRRQTAYCESNRRSYSNCGIKKILNLTQIVSQQPKNKSTSQSNQVNKVQTQTSQSQPQRKILCPECGKVMILRTDSKFKSHGLWYACSDWPTCRGTHGAHADGTPLGTPADQGTKRWRMRAHAAFDQIWQSHRMSRSEAYRFLSRSLEVPLDQCHIGSFSAEQCQKVVELCEKEGAGQNFEKKENFS